MNKRFRKGALAVTASALIGLSGCQCTSGRDSASGQQNSDMAEEVSKTVQASDNIPETVYGPPTDESSSGKAEASMDMNREASKERSALQESDYDPSEDEPEDIYGPPVDWDEASDDPMDEASEEEDIAVSELSDREDEYDPVDNVSELLYGPPADDREEASASYEPSENIPVTIYGPPDIL